VSHCIALSTGGGSETVEGTVVGFLHNASMEPFFCFEAALFCLALLSRHIFVLPCCFSRLATWPTVNTSTTVGAYCKTININLNSGSGRLHKRTLVSE
jgi:hypothetical protein